MSNTDKRRKEQSPAVKSYLIGYNLVQTIGWSIILYKAIAYYSAPSQKSLYDTVKCSLIFFQNAAILEVVHAFLRVVPSNPLITAEQIASRVVVVCGVLMLTQAARETVGLPLILFAWSITEVIRYANYTLNLLASVPYFLTYLRYTTFIALYPIGVTGELLCVYAAFKEVEKTKILTIQMPNPVNIIFNYQYFLAFILFLYIPLFPPLYLHMFTLRKKVLGPKEEKKQT